MRERLSTRVSRIVSGSLNALVDAMESAAPELVMEEAIREIDGAADEVRAELGRTIANRHLAGKRLAEENKRHAELAAQIAVAVDQGRDDLAEAGIARQLDIEAQLPILEQAIAAANAQEQELTGYLQALQAKRREMREELARLAERRREAAAVQASGDPHAGTSGGDGGGSGIAGRVARAESAFERVHERETGLTGGHGTPAPAEAAKLAELEGLTRRNRIQERLAALKAGRE